ncbi:MAG TPA: peroxide stress protein YaaA [Noviherbaspirillum sp.]|uniref:peroxide stress protein YaaA n=1 Tax=Noviherbaspirillum sp. TaxID=1926288 RepID=UPI002B477481|nr:peroxide stress protein YaaA [Noviherbaspirillum sp.]HJV87067.1 peroxide stress protein YaaA [Noviherbaspirillum sp.]
MLIVLSPAKTLDYDTPATTDKYTLPDFIDHASELIEILKPLSPAQVGSLMRISDALAVLNVTRYAAWSRKFTRRNAKQAILAFNGDVYEGLQASTLTTKQLDYVQAHVRILSGLYGMLRPLDLMQPYRLEMGTRLANPRGKDLYAFWDGTVTETLNETLRTKKLDLLVNLASEEYFKVVKPKLLRARVVTPVFEDWKDGRFKVISFYAKRARGLMARYAASNGISDVEQLKAFDAEGYGFDAKASTENNWVFRRRVAS